MNALSIGRRLLALNSASFFFRQASASLRRSTPWRRVQAWRRAAGDAARIAPQRCARGNAVDEQRPLAAKALNIARRCEAIVRALCGRSVIVAVLGRAPVAFHN